jgi:hypothetical protein
MNRNNAVNLGVWAALLLAVAICGTIVNFKPLLLGMDYKTTKGTVNGTFPNNHLGISYAYEVNGQTYQSSIAFGHGDSHIGDTVTVFYDERRPYSSSLEIPNVLFVRSIGQIIAASLILSVLGMCILHRYQLLPDYSIFSKCRPAKN